MNTKHMDLQTPYCASPLRRKSFAAFRTPRQSLLPVRVNDDDAEIQNRRRRESLATSTPIAASRQSFGSSLVSHLSTNQIQEKIRECIQLQTENKITMKNAFSLPAIEILSYYIKVDHTPNLQVATGSLDVSTKVYGLRVDRVYVEINKIYVNLGKDDLNTSNVEDVAEAEPATGEEQALVPKRKRKRRSEVLLKAEELRGTLQTMNYELAAAIQDDQQTSDVLNQIRAVFNAKDACYANNLDAPTFDTLEGLESPGNVNFYPIPGPDLEMSTLREPLSFAFVFSRTTECDSDDDTEVEPMHVDDDDEPPETYNFDLQEPVDNTSFPATQEMAPAAHARRDQSAPFLVDFVDTISANVGHQRESEYTYVPFNYIDFSRPFHWKIIQQRNTNSIQKTELCKQHRKKKEINIDFEDNEDIETQFSKSRARVKYAENTMNAWSEDKLVYVNLALDDNCEDKNDMFKCFTQSNRFIKKVRCLAPEEVDRSKRDLHQENENDELAAMNDDLDCYNGNDDHDDGDHDVDNLATQSDAGMLNALTGDNLVNAPDIIENVFIPYSRRAKKIDVRQVKKSMLKLINKKLRSSENEAAEVNGNDENDEESFNFDQLYKELPPLLSKCNAEAMSVPIAFVSLLHLANEQNLHIRSTEVFDNLIIKQDK